MLFAIRSTILFAWHSGSRSQRLLGLSRIPGRTSPMTPPLSVFTSPASSSKLLTQIFVFLEKLCAAAVGSCGDNENVVGVPCARIAAKAHMHRHPITRKGVFIVVSPPRTEVVRGREFISDSSIDDQNFVMLRVPLDGRHLIGHLIPPIVLILQAVVDVVVKLAHLHEWLR